LGPFLQDEFFKYNKNERIAVLTGFDKLMQQEEPESHDRDVDESAAGSRGDAQNVGAWRPMTNLVTAISLAQEKNEAALAQQVASPKAELDSDALMLLRHFAAFCKSRGVKVCPARPATIAMFIRSENALGVPVERVLASLAAITIMHDQATEANPCACSMPRAELAKILKVDAPRSWPKAERPLFYDLPPEVQAVVARRSEQDSTALRRLQNKVAEISKKGSNCNDDQKTD
jgi:hypothetical protein